MRWLLIGVFALAACTSNVTPTPGNPAPDLMLNGLDGGIVRLSDYRGKPVVMNLWATWCEPCKQEMPELVAASERYPDVVFLAVDQQEEASVVRPFVESFGVRFPVAIDSTGESQSRYRVRGLPTTVFIDKGGTIRHIQVGMVTRAILDQQIPKL